MKSHLILLTLCFFSLGLFAQDNVKPETSSDSKSITVTQHRQMETFAHKNNPNKTFGFYVGIGGGYSAVENFDLINLHARLAFITNGKFEIGVGGEVVQSYVSNINLDKEEEFLSGAFGGIHLKKIFFGHKKIHFSIPMLVGLGAIAQINDTPRNLFDCFDPELGTWTPTFFIEPGINLELNISRVVGFELGAKYRFASQGILETPIDSFNGYTLGGTLKIGFFDFGRNRLNRF